MYIYLTKNNRVKEIIPTFSPLLPGVPINERYPEEFIDLLIEVEDSELVKEGFIYDNLTNSFREPTEEDNIQIKENINKELTPSQIREQLYNTSLVIEWENKILTITEASQIWAYYAAENSNKALQISELIIQEKNKIRLEHPD